MKKFLILSGLLFILGFPCFAMADTLVFNGDYLRVGVGNAGGLIDDNFVVGIDYDKTGTSTWTTFDFLKPGTPFEFYSVGVGGVWDAAGYTSGNPFSATTTDNTAGGVFSAVTNFSYGDLSGVQTLTFPAGSGTISFEIVLTNSGDSALEDIVYARGLDPDQDVFAGGGYPTTNVIVNGNLVIGSAPITDWTIGIFSDSTYEHVPGISGPWDQDPYALLLGPDDGFGDNSINMAWNLGSLNAGESATFAFEYRIAETSGEVIGTIPEPSTMLLLGAGLAGLVAVARKRQQA